jgi:hypothetical protein
MPGGGLARRFRHARGEHDPGGVKSATPRGAKMAFAAP